MIAALFLSFFMSHLSTCVSSSEIVCQGIERHKNALLLPKPPSCGPIKPITRIMGGSDALVGEFPWMAFIRIPESDDKNSLCGGSVINKRYILSAAHCFRRHSIVKKAITVTLGENFKNDKKGMVLSTKDVIMHEEFSGTTAVNDIALLRLSADIAYNELIYPICLPLTCELLNEPLHNKFVTVAGWGLKQKEYVRRKTKGKKAYLRLSFEHGVFVGNKIMGEPYSISSDSLQKLALRSVDSEVCKEAFKKSPFTFTDKHICTMRAYEFPQSACPGDSGSPEMWMSGGVTYQVGVVSWGAVCNPKRKDLFNAVTRVSSYMLWILDHISE